MGDWTYVEGTHNSKRVSMKKLAELIVGDELGFRNLDGSKFEFSFPYSGISAAELLEKICQEFKRLDKNARLSMEVRVGFYC